MFELKKYVSFSLFLSAAVLLGAVLLSRVGTAIAVLTEGIQTAPVVVIDPGHGGEDGGAVSASGIRESQINLEISLRLNDLLHLLGVETRMIRSTDVSVYTEGETIAQKKVSDIRNRVKFVEQTPGAVLLSIHQNYFPQSQYRGAQVFYAATGDSKIMAEAMQQSLAQQVDTRNHRECKAAADVYLMEHVTCPALLIECGFLSNPEEDLLLQEEGYQKKLAAVIGCCILTQLGDTNEI